MLCNRRPRLASALFLAPPVNLPPTTQSEPACLPPATHPLRVSVVCLFGTSHTNGMIQGVEFYCAPSLPQRSVFQRPPEGSVHPRARVSWLSNTPTHTVLSHLWVDAWAASTFWLLRINMCRLLGEHQLSALFGAGPGVGLLGRKAILFRWLRNGQSLLPFCPLMCSPRSTSSDFFQT